MEAKIDLGDGKSLSWDEFVSRPSFAKKNPGEKAKIRQNFISEVLGSKEQKDITEDDISSLQENIQAIEHPATAEGAKAPLSGKWGQRAVRSIEPLVPQELRTKLHDTTQRATDIAYGAHPALGTAMAGAGALGETLTEIVAPIDIATAGLAKAGPALKMAGRAGGKAAEMLGKLGGADYSASGLDDLGGLAKRGLSKAGEAIGGAKKYLSEDAALERTLKADLSATRAKGAPTPPRGSLPAGPEAPKPLLEKPARPKVEEPLVEPGSDPMGSPEAMQRAQMEASAASKAAEASKPVPKALSKTDELAAAKAGEAELRGAPQPKGPAIPRKQTAEDVAIEAKLDKGIETTVAGGVPVDAPTPKKTSWLRRTAHKLTKDWIDPNADLKELGYEDLHRTLTQGGDKNVALWGQDMKAANNVLETNLKTPSDRVLWNYVYRLRSSQEVWEKAGLDYGGIGSKAQGKIEAAKNALIKTGQTERQARIWRAVEEYADATASKGLERARNVIGGERADMLKEKYRYYSSFQDFDADAVKLAYGEEGVAQHSIPAMEDFATGFTKSREGGKAVLADAHEAFMQSHWNKVVASHKKNVIDKAVSRSIELSGKDLSKEIELVGGKGYAEYTLSDGRKVIMPEPVKRMLTESDPHAAGLFDEIYGAVAPMSRRGYLDLNTRYYSGMMHRDISEHFLRAPGYLTPQTEAITKKIGGWTGIKQDVPDLEYKINPMPFIRGLKASFRVNFKNQGVDKIYEALEASGALQTGSISHAKKMHRISTQLPTSAPGKLAKAANYVYEGMGNIMKAWDDTIRIGTMLRNTPKEMRGFKGMKALWKAEELPVGPVPSAEMNEIARNLFIDFRMIGNKMRPARKLNPFINPAIQDKFQTYQYAKKQPISFAMTTSAMLATAAYGYMRWKSTPEGEKLNPRDTQRFMLVDSGLRNKDGGVYAIPVGMIPDAIQPAWIAMRNVIDIMHEKSPEFREILKKNYASKTLSQGAGAVVNISGPLVAGAETMFNYSLYQNKEVEGRYDPNLSAEFRARKNVPNVFRYIGKKTGFSPDKMAYLTRGVTGAPGISLAGNTYLDTLLSDKVSFPREGSEKPKPVSSWLAGQAKSLPKTMGLVREQKYDSSYDRAQEMMAPTLGKASDVRAVVRGYGKRYGQEKDPKIKAAYLEQAKEAYKRYVASLDPEERSTVVAFPDVWNSAVKDSAEAAATGIPKTRKSWMKRFPHIMQKVETPKEEEQAP